MEVVGGQEPHLDAGERDQRVRWRARSRWPSEVLVDSEIVLVVTGPSSPRGIARFGELVEWPIGCCAGWTITPGRLTTAAIVGLWSTNGG
jgi:hypothetical protein